MTYTRINPQQSTAAAGAVAEGGFTVTGQRFVRYGPFTMFFLNATAASALAADAMYSVATIPYTPSFGGATVSVGLANLATTGLLQVRPTIPISAGTTLYFRGYFAL